MTPETTLQIKIVELLSTLARQNNFIYFSVPNEAALKTAGLAKIPKKAQYAIMMILKKMGLLPGISDLCIVKEGGKFYGMEVKTEKGMLSVSQRYFHGWCKDHKVPYTVVRSVDDVMRVLREWEVIG